MSAQFLPTLVLPLSREGQIDYPALDRLLTYYFRHGASGILLDWQAGELAWLVPDLQLEVATYCLRLCRTAHKTCFFLTGAARLDLARLQPDGLILPVGQATSRLAEKLPAQTRLGLVARPEEPLMPARLRQLASGGSFSFVLADYSQPTGPELLDQCHKEGLTFYNTDGASLLESHLAGAAGYCGSLFGFMPQVFLVLQRYLQDDGDFLPHDRRRAEEFARFIALAAPYAAGDYPARQKYLLERQGLINSSQTLDPAASHLCAAEKRQLDALASQAVLQRSRADLFPQRQLIFAAGAHFPSCHAATILPLPDGTILVAYFAGTAEGQPDLAIWLSRFKQGSWQVPVRIAKVDQTAHWNPVLFLDGSTVRLIFKKGPRITDWQSWSISSADAGLSWSSPVPLPGHDQALGPVRSKPLRLSNGLLLAGNSTESKTSWQAQVDVSQDGGKTFACLAKIPHNSQDPAGPDYLAGKGAIQPVLWESSPGRVHLLLRTTAGWIFRSDSDDYGQTWCRAYRTGLPSNNSGIEIVQQGGRLYLVFNPVQGNWASRNPLVIWTSDDNGLSFTHYLTLEGCPVDPQNQGDAEYSYPAALVAAGKLYVAYTYNRRQLACCIIDLEEQGKKEWQK